MYLATQTLVYSSHHKDEYTSTLNPKTSIKLAIKLATLKHEYITRSPNARAGSLFDQPRGNRSSANLRSTQPSTHALLTAPKRVMPNRRFCYVTDQRFPTLATWQKPPCSEKSEKRADLWTGASELIDAWRRDFLTMLCFFYPALEYLPRACLLLNMFFWPGAIQSESIGEGDFSNIE